MGAVYQGWQKSLRRLVAIKILPPGLEDNGANFAERFRREALTVRQEAEGQAKNPNGEVIPQCSQSSGSPTAKNLAR